MCEKEVTLLNETIISRSQFNQKRFKGKRETSVVVQFYFWFKFCFLLVWVW